METIPCSVCMDSSPVVRSKTIKNTSGNCNFVSRTQLTCSIRSYMFKNVSVEADAIDPIYYRFCCLINQHFCISNLNIK